MPKLRRTLIIGLGGTGFTTILNAKKMFYENYGEIPPMIAFLGIDTDKPGLEDASVTAKDGTKITLSQSEKLAICVEEPTNLYRNGIDSGRFDWLPQVNVNSLTTITAGAGGIRTNGRFAATVNERKLENLLVRKMTEVNDAHIIDNDKYGLLGAETEVHMAFSIGGGTGCGTFINIAYLIKRLFPKVKLSGYGVLADVFRLVAPGASTARARSNAKAAIMELDFLAHLELTSKPVKIKWLQRADEVRERPFNAFYMVDNRNANGDTFDKVEPICEMISLAVVTSVGEIGVGVASVADNVDQQIGDRTMDIKNKKAWVAGMGCTEIIFDGTRLGNIYSYKAGVQIINSMLNGGCDDPAIIANSWFDINKIRENHGRDDVIDYFMSPTPPYSIQSLNNPENSEHESRAFISNRATENPQALKNKLNELTHRIDVSLTELMEKYINGECGVSLCNDILHSILHIVEKCDGEMKNELKNLEDALPGSESALKTSCIELSNCMGTMLKFGKKDYIKDVCANTMNLATQLREIERRKYAHTFYEWLRVRCGESIREIDKIMQNLIAVKSEFNQKALQLVRTGKATSFFQIDLSDTEAEKITCPISDIVFNNFVLEMANSGGIQSIAGMSTDQTARLIHSYAKTLPGTKKYNGMSVDTILDKMSEEQFRTMTQRAIQKSLPLLPYSYRGYEADLRTSPAENYFIGVADKKKSRLAKDNAFKNLVPDAQSVRFSDTGLKDRVIIYRQICVIPAFTVRALDNYDNEFMKAEKDRPHSSHLDENMVQRMEKERYSLMPRDVANGAKVLETWVNAIIYDLISYDAESGQYRIKSRGMGGKPLDGWLVNMGSSRKEAFDYLTDNFDILSAEIRDALEALDVPGPDNIIRINSARAKKAVENNTYLTEVSKCPIPMESIRHYPDERDLIEKEMTFILEGRIPS